ncbi:hypothetical protein ACWGLE_19440 [Streptomyces sp. NPDC055897]
MTPEPERSTDESPDVQEARLAIEEYLSRTRRSARPDESTEAGGRRSADGNSGSSEDGGRFDDRMAESIARAAWDAVQDATPPPPDPAAGPAEKTEQPPELAELHRRAVAIARGLRELGYHLDETLLPGPDMAAG